MSGIQRAIDIDTTLVLQTDQRREREISSFHAHSEKISGALGWKPSRRNGQGGMCSLIIRIFLITLSGREGRR